MKLKAGYYYIAEDHDNFASIIKVTKDTDLEIKSKFDNFDGWVLGYSDRWTPATKISIGDYKKPKLIPQTEEDIFLLKI